MNRGFQPWLGLLMLLALAGCATSSRPSFPITGDPLVDAPRGIAEGPPRDRVLWEYRLAAAEMRQAQFSEAARTLDSALVSIGGIFNADKNSRAARGYFKEEAKKTFLGEPYERVMAYYYRGILYWMAGEPDNARACFRNALFQDADAEDKDAAADYVVLDYLDGLVSLKLGGDGADAFQRARANCKLAIPPDPIRDVNVLVFLDYGQGPVKYATGEYGEQLRFRPGPSQAREVVLRVGEASVHVGPYDDLNFQATTRGGRVMDHILGNKAVFKSTTDTIGNVALIGGAATAIAGSGQNNSMSEVGLGIMAAGLVAKIISAATTPQADTRSWDNLPLYLSFATLRLPPGAQTMTVEFLDPGRQPLPALSKTVSFTVPADGRDKVLFVSDQSTTPQTQ